jgi:hypothetical protein
MTISSDSIAVTPTLIFEELAFVREERGLYYAASLIGALSRNKEINALAEASLADEKIVKQADAYVSVLNSYLRALRSMSADSRWTSYGTEWRGLGRNADSLLLRFNQLDILEEDIPVGWGKLSGQYLGYMSENYVRMRQAKIVKSFVTEGDTLVSICVDGLVELLKKGDMSDLIENESEGLKNNYESYLYRLESSGEMPDINNDRNYISLVRRIEKVKNTRTRCVTALQSLKRAHKKLVTELDKRRNIDYILEDMIELNSLSLQLYSMFE